MVGPSWHTSPPTSPTALGRQRGVEAGDFLPAFISRRSGHHTSFCSGTFVFIIGRTFAPSFFVTNSPSKPERSSPQTPALHQGEATVFGRTKALNRLDVSFLYRAFPGLRRINVPLWSWTGCEGCSNNVSAPKHSPRRSRTQWFVCNGTSAVVIPKLVYQGRKPTHTPPFTPVPPPGPFHSLLPLRLAVSISAPPSPFANKPRSLPLLDLPSRNFSSMDMDVNMILGPIVLAVVVNVSPFPLCLQCSSVLNGSCRPCCTGRVWFNGTRTGPPVSRIHGTPG